VYRYRDPLDQEVVGLLAAVLAYGRVGQICNAIGQVLAYLGPRPYRRICRLGPSLRQDLAGFRHRFTSGNDIADLLEVLHARLPQAGSLQGLFMSGYDRSSCDILVAIDRFCQALLDTYTHLHGASPGKGLRYLLAMPSSGSGCKRLNMFLRWMVRDDQVDTGLWKGIEPSCLIVPIDTHINRICMLLGMHAGKAVTVEAAVRLTDRFRMIRPDDPVRYDFALSRVGIVEGCTGRPSARCARCGLGQFCLV